MMPKIWKFRDSATNVAQIPTSYVWRHQNKKNLDLLWTWNCFFYVKSLILPWRIKHWYLIFIINSFQNVIELNFALIILKFQNQNLPSSNACSFFRVYMYLFEVTWLFTWASVIQMDFEIFTKVENFGVF